MVNTYTNLIEPYITASSKNRDYRWLKEAAELSDLLMAQVSHGHLKDYQNIVQGIWSLRGNSQLLSSITKPNGSLGLPWFEHIELESPEYRKLLDMLNQLKPWRKGPWSFGPIEIETEWRSDWKWERVMKAFPGEKGKSEAKLILQKPLRDKRVLDVGTGSGYHLWRMQEAGAELVIGIEPFLLSVAQFYASYPSIVVSKNFQLPPLVLPLTLEQCPKSSWFQIVFSMGVLSHRRSPFDHLADVRTQLEPGGQIILENLVIDGKEGEVLVPRGRYAKMRNVWFIPSAKELQGWLKKMGFVKTEIVDITDTTTLEQQKTPWMEFESLEDFLDPEDSSKTIEGYPAPKRAVLTAWLPE